MARNDRDEVADISAIDVRPDVRVGMLAPVTERDFEADLHAPAAARSFATRSLAEILRGVVSPSLSDDVELVVSELVTNAVRAGSPNVHVEVALIAEGRLSIRVTDAADGWPQPRDASITDIGGRGLALVGAVADTWGVRMSPTSKTVWAELAVPD